eukprot:g1347.t1
MEQTAATAWVERNLLLLDATSTASREGKGVYVREMGCLKAHASYLSAENTDRIASGSRVGYVLLFQGCAPAAPGEALSATNAPRKRWQTGSRDGILIDWFHDDCGDTACGRARTTNRRALIEKDPATFLGLWRSVFV